MTAHAAYLESSQEVDARFASVDCVFFVIGAQKAGTTWLSHYFKAHPNVSVPEWKEHDYWNMVEGRPNASRMLQTQKARREKPSALRSLAAALPFTLHARRQRAITLALKATQAPFAPYSAYADVILENKGDKTQAAGEICPEYALLKSDTFARMAALSPNVRFIFLMRDPVSRFISGARHSLRKKLGKTPPTPQDLSDFIGRFHKRTVALSRYDQTIAALEEAVPADRILYVFFEDLFDQTQVKDICAFLGVPFVPGRIHRKSNIAGKSAVPVSAEDRARIAGVLKPVYDFAKRRFGTRLPQKWQESAALC
ncbi:MAG: sulfotransferase [Pseudomonadota bacterium]